MAVDLNELGEHIAASLGDAVLDRRVAYGELTGLVQGDAIVRVATFLRDDPRSLSATIRVWGGAYPPGRESRCVVFYPLQSSRKTRRIRVKVQTDEVTPVPSVITVYPTANWFEWEA